MKKRERNSCKGMGACPEAWPRGQIRVTFAAHDGRPQIGQPQIGQRRAGDPGPDVPDSGDAAARHPRRFLAADGPVSRGQAGPSDHLLSTAWGISTSSSSRMRPSAALAIALTKRGKADGGDIPMCGVPVCRRGLSRQADPQGFKVAVCEQIEDPAEARSAAQIRGPARCGAHRDAGHPDGETLLDARSHNYLAAIADVGGAIAWVDISTGDFAVQPLGPSRARRRARRLQPGEILLPDRCSSTRAAGLWPIPEPARPARGALERGGAPRLEQVSRSRRWRLRQLRAGRRSPPAAPWSTISRRRSSAACRGWPHRGASPPARSWRSMRRPGAISSSRAGSPATGRARCWPPSTARSAPAVPGASPIGWPPRSPIPPPSMPGSTCWRPHRRAPAARGSAPRPAARPISSARCSRLLIGRGGPRSGGAWPRPRRRGAARSPRLADLPAGLRQAEAALGDHGALVAGWAAPWGRLPVIARDGGFIAPAIATGSTSFAASRREPAPGARAGAALSRGDRHLLPQDPPQQCAGLLRRDRRRSIWRS